MRTTENMNIKVKAIPLEIGSLTATPKDLKKWLSEIGLVTNNRIPKNHPAPQS